MSKVEERRKTPIDEIWGELEALKSRTPLRERILYKPFRDWSLLKEKIQSPLFGFRHFLF